MTKSPKTRRYFTLLVRDNSTSPWAIHFGDYDRAVAVQECHDIVRQNGGNYWRADTRIINTADDQASIDAAVAALNAPRTGAEVSIA